MTEGAICNVFVREKGEWRTPPLDCGLLAGTMRGELIETLGAEEVPFTPATLYRASEILLTNSIRGVVRATLCKQEFPVYERSQESVTVG